MAADLLDLVADDEGGRARGEFVRLAVEHFRVLEQGRCWLSRIDLGGRQSSGRGRRRSRRLGRISTLGEGLARPAGRGQPDEQSANSERGSGGQKRSRPHGVVFVREGEGGDVSGAVLSAERAGGAAPAAAGRG
jgi:hypothetical protein